MNDRQNLISSFLDIAVGHTEETAILCLQETKWNLAEAINFFFNQRNNQYLSSQNPHPFFGYDSVAEDKPLEEIWDSTPDSVFVEPNSRLSSLYQPPTELCFNGSFHDAKLTSCRENLWLLVNLQSPTEFACHTLNRDLWSNDAVSQAIQSSFVLSQINESTIEGQKITSYYKIETRPPVVLLIDPITGQQMRMWSGIIEPQSFLEDLMKYIDAGPQQNIASHTRNKPLITEKIHTDDHDNCEEFHNLSLENMETFSASNATPPRDEIEDHEEDKMETDHNKDTRLGFPDLSEEPKGECDRTIVCNLCVRFPDGKRKQRKFLKTEPVQLLWSFCYSQMEESEKKAFKLVQTIPGASKTLDYGENVTFDQSGLANSIISVIWE